MQQNQSLDNLEELLSDEQSKVLKDTLQNAHPADIADALEGLSPDDRPGIIKHISTDITGEVLTELSDGVFKDVATSVDKDALIESIRTLDIDDIADLIPNLPEHLIADVLYALDVDKRNTLGEVLAYPEDSAGGLMDLEATVVRDDISMKVLMRFLRLKRELPSHTDAIYLVSNDNKLTGILPINILITAPINDLAKDHMISKPVSFLDNEHHEDIAKAFADYDIISAPVVSKDNILLGRITIDDVVDVIREQAEHDFMVAAGLNTEDDIFAPVAKTSRNRAVWLAVNLLTAILGSWVIGQFEGSIQQLVALAVLMPIIASMGGNAGTQTLTVVIRGMSTGTITSHNVSKVLKKEFFVGILNGLLWAFVIAIIASAWYQNIALGLVIATAMVANLIIGALAGVFIPVLLDKINVDPALAGGVALTTVTDVVGYFSVLGLATLLLL